MPVPKGFSPSEIEGEKTVNGGFVIYQGDIDWSIIKNLEENEEKKEKEILKLQSSYNQYVWVPVNEQELKEIYGVGNNSKLWGKMYSYTSTGRTPLDWKENDGKITVGTGKNYFEPGLGYGSNAQTLNELTVQILLHMSREQLSTELEYGFYQTIKSIKTYGGFYIGRYETAIQDNEAIIQKMKKDVTYQSWGMMYQKTQKIKEENDNVITSMIWSSLWDHTIQWFINTKAQTYETVCDSTSWGNYLNTSFEYYTDIDANKSTKQEGDNKSGVIPSGASDYTKSNNIYDMAGNVSEFTLGSYGYSFCYRGGYFTTNNSQRTSCAYRYYTTINFDAIDLGSRAIMTIK